MMLNSRAAGRFTRRWTAVVAWGVGMGLLPAGVPAWAQSVAQGAAQATLPGGGAANPTALMREETLALLREQIRLEEDLLAHHHERVREANRSHEATLALLREREQQILQTLKRLREREQAEVRLRDQVAGPSPSGVPRAPR